MYAAVTRALAGFIAMQLCCVALLMAQPNAAKGRDYEVNVTSVIARRAASGPPFYEVVYHYRFDQRSTVHVVGLGTVPAAGTFAYLTAQAPLEFRDAANGQLLALVPLKPTAVTMQPGATDTPHEEFPPEFRSGEWSRAATFVPATTKVLQKHFPYGFIVRQVGGINEYVTTFRTLHTGNANLLSQIAVRVTHPYDAAADRLSYRIQYLARDRPRLSDTWRLNDERNQLTLAAALKALEALLNDLAAAGAVNP